jgi:DNA-binding PadR family transcriptional regulator
MGYVSGIRRSTIPATFLILKTILIDSKHGWAIAKRIQQISREALQIQQGSLYPALHRLEQQAASVGPMNALRED